MSDNSAAPQILSNRLQNGEALIWWDRPIPSRAAKREFGAGFFMAIFFTAFSLFWMITAYGAPGLFFLFGAPFLAFGLWLLSAPIRGYYRAQSTCYALTNRRAMILANSVVKSFPLEQIEFVESESAADGSGHVFFYKDNPSYFWPHGNFYAPVKSGFIAVRDADRISGELSVMRKKAKSIQGAGPA